MQTIRYEKTPPEPAPEHEYAKLFPLLEGEARERLVEDIRVNGVLEPIVFFNGSILDGRNRYYAARELLIEYPRIEYEGDDPLAFVISRNMHRRHLTESQRASAAAKIAKLHVGDFAGNQHVGSANLPTPPVSQASAAEMLNVSPRSVRTARQVIEHGTPALVDAVDAGKVSISAAAEVAELPQDEQEEVVAHGEEAILDEAKRIRERKRQERLAKQRENDAARDKARSALPDSVKRAEQAKAANGSVHVALAGRKGEDLEAIKAERDELREENAALKADLAERDKRLALFDDIAVQWEKGGFDAVKAVLDDRIHGLKRQVEDLSAERATLAKSRDWWKKQAFAHGYVSPNSQDEAPPPDAIPTDIAKALPF